MSTGDNEIGTTVSNGIVECSVDFRGKPSIRSASGGWRSSGFIIGKSWHLFSPLTQTFPPTKKKREYSGRCGSGGEIRLLRVASNLITYFTGPLEQSTAVAASNVNLWLGTAAFLPLIWGSIADSFLGRFRTILLTSSFYILVIR